MRVDDFILTEREAEEESTKLGRIESHQVVGIVKDNKGRYWVEVTVPNNYDCGCDVIHSFPVGVDTFVKPGKPNWQYSLGIPLDINFLELSWPYDEYGGI